MSTVADLTLDALRAYGVEALPAYASFLRQAFDSAPPPFGMHWYGEKFRALACDPSWLATSLIQNAQVEGDGARKLWNLAGRTANAVVADHVRRHAVDESRHALLYLAMLDHAFPNAVDNALRPLLDEISPRFAARHAVPELARSTEEWVLDELVQMNIGEIRTRIHQLLLRPVLIAHTAVERRAPVQRILDSLLSDETKHVAYTGRLIEDAISGGHGEYVRDVMARRVRDFNEITVQEVGSEQFAGE